MSRPRVSLVTGASRGLGRALVEALLARGDRVIAAVREASSTGGVMVGVAEGVAEGGAGELTVLELDVTSTSSARAAAERWGGAPIDLLINNAGMTGGPQRAPGMDLDRAARIVDVNAMGPLRVYDAFAANLRASGRPGVVVNVSSEAGSFGQFRLGSKPEYAMSKAALNMLTRWVAGSDAGLVCVSMHPGWVRTATGGEGAPLSPGEAAARLLAAIDRLTPGHSGGFFDADLAPLPW